MIRRGALPPRCVVATLFHKEEIAGVGRETLAWALTSKHAGSGTMAEAMFSTIVAKAAMDDTKWESDRNLSAMAGSWTARDRTQLRLAWELV